MSAPALDVRATAAVTAKQPAKGAQRITAAGVVFLLLTVLLIAGWYSQTERYITPQRGLATRWVSWAQHDTAAVHLHGTQAHSLACLPRARRSVGSLSHDTGVAGPLCISTTPTSTSAPRTATSR